MLSNKIKNLLLPYQINNAENIIRILGKNNSVLDASDTGTGKTYTAVASCASMNKMPLVVCPKAVMATWKHVCKLFNVKPFFIVNYETIKNCKYYDKNNDRIKCEHVSYDTNDKIYVWKNIPSEVIFIFDEAHKCSNLDSLNGQLLLAVKESVNNPIIIISATIADNPEKFRLFFYILNFIDAGYAKEHDIDFKKYNNIMGKWITRDPKTMIRIHNMLYPDRATRMSIDVLGNLFPQTQITATPYSMGKKRETEIQMEYETIEKELDKLKDKSNKNKKRENPLVRILRAHQKIELLKIPTFVELATDFMNEGFSVVIFVNFTQTLKTLADLLFTDCIIYGEQTDYDRQTNIEKFQSNKKKNNYLQYKSRWSWNFFTRYSWRSQESFSNFSLLEFYRSHTSPRKSS